MTCSQRDKFISVRKKGTISFEKGNLFHVIHIILPILRQFRAFGAHQRIIKICNKKIADLLSLQYELLYYIIIFLTVCIYPPTRNSREGPLPRYVSELSPLLFSHMWIYEISCTWTEEKDSIDHRSYARNVSSCEIKAWKQFMLKRYSNQRPLLRSRCSALPTGLWNQLEAGHFLMLNLNSRSFPRLWFSLFQFTS